ncbi:hypothetical protein Poli38472_006307 [Pythium oligandrum]|uniref:Transmembrane protein 14 n=1 Tax=Pythium oligandrum TaxID=41045 RepID=A0A8K1CT98_PYTOL|nr:hypothetical protein Poli38472_006307 [Pythium oligandrum]|eukprot:TMW68839.1 hypothetical protein Poli38472_006307 [Pythium oligandrum]
MSSHHPTYTMAALLGVGGAMGYIRTKSVPSLVAGVTLGAGFGLAGYMLQSGSMTQGHGTALFFSTITMSAMGVRAMRTRKTLPVAISAIGALSSAYHAQRFTQWIGQE